MTTEPNLKAVEALLIACMQKLSVPVISTTVQAKRIDITGCVNGCCRCEDAHD